jgi:hypothetical protein
MRLTLLLLAGLSTVQAAEPTGTLTLACEGTEQHRKERLEPYGEPDAISMGIIINFANRTVEFAQFKYPTMQITDVTETTIFFYGSDSSVLLFGTIDRILGTVEAEYRGPLMAASSFSLKCKPTQRMF